MKTIQNLLANWKTTSAGLTMIVGSTVHLIFQVRAGTANENTWTISLTAIIGGIGLLVAGDASAPAQPPLTAPPAGDTVQPSKPQTP